ncbi:MAG: FKBP-type peptidyl-prolyl cis-trans isomerase [bacterium]
MFSVILIAGCTNKNSVKLGDTVSIVYTATFPDGKLFDQNTQQTPLIFTVGS